ncbi:TonB-dependent receptor [Prolixibacteraceae bacterium Z1-6]|uniref:TonB-dependent receptor n=1 Tax=Draconibacterium aestuarii TaxID=2998507 RepID=A0A9X3F7M9_9BACT|nr:TonB-dependent receptor [Prolixibacteraceae bacterium Z1-6]
MKLTILLVLALTFQTFASSYAQTAKINMSMRNATINQVIQKIEQETEFYFMLKYDDLIFEKKVDVDFEDAKITDVLDQLFDNEKYNYKIIDRYIAITLKDEQTNTSQQEAITGMITDDNGEPLPGVTVIKKGTTTGTVSQFDGSYRLSAQKGNILVFSFVGMKSKEITIGDQQVIDVTLEFDAIGIEEVVAIGYGVVKKSDLTGSVSSLNEEDMNAGAVSSVDELIQGRTPGVQVIQSSAEPGGGMAIRIRGAGSINASSSPLYVIDGLPIDNGQVTAGSGADMPGSRAPRNPLSSINPADIESIEILKDASATAIYGARGANGVILVTTKSGKDGAFSVNYNCYVGTQTPANLIDLLSPEEYMTVMNDILADGGGNPEEQVTGVQNGGTDWQKAITRDAMVQSHSLSFSGGNGRTSFYTSLNYFNQEGIVVNSAFKRYDARLNIQHKVDKFTLGANFTTSYTQDDYLAYGYAINEEAGALYAALNFDPTLQIYNEDGTFQTSPYITTDNPMALATGKDGFGNSYRTLGSFFGQYEILPGWTAKLNGGFDVQFSRRDVFIDRTTKNGAGAGGIATIINGIKTNYLFEGTTTYMKDFNEDHSMTLMGGTTYQAFNTDRSTMNAQNFPNDITRTWDMDAADPTLFSEFSNKSTYKLLSFIARANYSYKNKYLFTATFRADGSSRFGENNKFSYFPSLAGAWKMHDEDFIKYLNTFSLLKLRGSWGITGNQGIGNYQSLTTFATGTTAVLNGQQTTTLDPSRIGNSELKWETTEQLNFGIDMGFFENRVYTSMDYYTKETTDMLLALPVPSSTGFTSVLQNIGSIRNQGFEFMIETRNFIGEFKWNTNLNFSTIKNEVLSLGDIPEIIHEGAGWTSGIALIREGAPLNSFYGYNVMGVWQQDDDFSVTTDPVAPGDTKYEDINGDGKVNADDRVILGNSFPTLNWGLSNNLSYKGFGLNFFIEGVHGVSMLNNNLVDSYFPINFRRNKLAEPYLNRWTPENPTNEYPSFVNPNGQGSKGVNSKTVEDASYIRLKTVKLSYDINMANKVFKKATVYVTGQNLLTLTDYSGYDPSTNSNGNPSLKIDYNSYPVAKTYMIGVEINF